MDSIFEYLAILFLIFSFLGPLFKKKDQKGKQQPKRPERPPQQGEEKREVTLDDLLGEMFGQKPKQRQKEHDGGLLGEEEPPSIDPKPHTWNPAEEYGYEEETPPANVERKERQSVADYARKLRGKYRNIDAGDVEDIIKKQKQGKSEIEKTKVASVKLYESKHTKEIRRILRNPETLRNYVLISEILDKPRALRRR